MVNKKELEKLKQEIPKMKRWSPLYHVLKTELTFLGHWQNRPRGDPKKGFRSGMGKGNE